MNWEQRKSGLVAPKPEPPPPKRQYGALEIQSEDQRKAVEVALLNLWDALGLSGPGCIRLPEMPSREAHKAHHRLYCFVGEMLLGADCPGRDELT